MEVRLLAERIPRDLGQIVLANEEGQSDPLNLPMNNLSPPIKAPGRLFNVSLATQKVSLATVKLPEEGNSFVVMLLLNPPSGYKPLVIPFNNGKFRGGDVYFYNNTNKTVLGILGSAKFSLRPGQGDVVTPSGFGDQRYYHATLGVKEADGNRVIKSMKWPSSKTVRNYVFFYIHPEKKRITYRAVDEFILPKKKAASGP